MPKIQEDNKKLAPLELRKALKNYLETKLELNKYIDSNKYNGFSDFSKYRFKDANLNHFIVELWGNDIEVKKNPVTQEYSFAHNNFLFLTGLADLKSIYSLFHNNYLPGWRYYPFLDEEKTVRELEAIKARKIINITSPDLLVIDKNHPNDPPFTSFLLIISILSQLTSKYEGFSIIKNLDIERIYDTIYPLKSSFEDIIKEHRQNNNDDKDDVYKKLTDCKNSILQPIFNEIEKVVQWVKQASAFVGLVEQSSNLKGYEFEGIAYLKDLESFKPYQNFKEVYSVLKQDVNKDNLRYYDKSTFRPLENDESSNHDVYVKDSILGCVQNLLDVCYTFKNFYKQAFLPLINTKKFQNHYLASLNALVDRFNVKIKDAIRKEDADFITKYAQFYDDVWTNKSIFKANIEVNDVFSRDDYDDASVACAILQKLNINQNLTEISLQADINDILYKDLLQFSDNELGTLELYLLDNIPFRLLDREGYLVQNLKRLRKASEKIERMAYGQNTERLTEANTKLEDLLDQNPIKYEVYNGSEELASNDNLYAQWLARNQEEPDFNEEGQFFLLDFNDNNKCYSFNLNSSKFCSKFLTYHFIAMLMWKINIILCYRTDLKWFVANENESRLDICNQYKEDNSYEQEIKPFATNTKFKR